MFEVILTVTLQGGLIEGGQDYNWDVYFHQTVSDPVPKGKVDVLLTEKDCKYTERNPSTLVLQNYKEDGLRAALKKVPPETRRIFVMGEARGLEQALSHPECQRVHWNMVLSPRQDCTQFLPFGFPPFPVFSLVSDSWMPIQHQDLTYVPLVFERKHEEYQYLNLIQSVLRVGSLRPNRTGVDTLALFGNMMRFSLRQNKIPLLTTKRVFWRGIVEELLWFIKGGTDARTLSAKRVKIWDGNGSREALDACGLTQREEGDLGPVYGHQWRHFGATYKDCHTDYTGQGIDQLQDLIDRIRTQPNDRRLVMTAWNPLDLSQMALPPCHMFVQFFVDQGELTSLMYQRSADLGLGVPFNIASYALLTKLMAQVCGLEAVEFIHVLGDTHVYTNHSDALQEQLQRTPRPFPTLKIDPRIQTIDGFEWEHLTLENYDPYPALSMPLAVVPNRLF